MNWIKLVLEQNNVTANSCDGVGDGRGDGTHSVVWWCLWSWRRRAPPGAPSRSMPAHPGTWTESICKSQHTALTYVALINISRQAYPDLTLFQCSVMTKTIFLMLAIIVSHKSYAGLRLLVIQNKILGNQ